MTETRNRQFPVALTADLLGTDGKPRFADIGLTVLTSLPGIEAVPMREFFPVVRPESANTPNNSETLRQIAIKATL